MDIIEPKDLPESSFETPEKKVLRDCDWGIGCTSGNGNVYVNKNLKKYNPKIYEAVVNHEMGHDLGPYNTNDLQTDLLDNFLTLKEKLKFCLQYPKGFFYFWPIHVIKVPEEWKEDKKYEITIDLIGLFRIGVELAILAFILFWVI